MSTSRRPRVDLVAVTLLAVWVLFFLGSVGYVVARCVRP
jgi:hypothetical protein